MKALAAALILSIMVGGTAVADPFFPPSVDLDITPLLPPPEGMSHADMPPALLKMDDGPILPLTGDLWHPEFSIPHPLDEIMPIDEVAPEPVTLLRAQGCLIDAVNMIEYGMAAYVRWIEEDCHHRGLNWQDWDTYDMPDFRYDLELENMIGWSEDAFYQPKPGNFVLPSLHEAQACIAYMVWRADTGEHDTPSDKFCALRGLYLNSIDSID